MKTFLTIVRWILSFLLATLLLLVIFIGLNSLVISSKVSQPEDIKEWLSRADIYENLVPVGLELIKQSVQVGTLENSTALDEQELENVARSVLEPTWVQTQVEIVIDAIYSWFAGETENLEFTIDFEGRKEAIADAINLLLKNKFENAEICSAANIAELQSQGEGGAEFNPFSYNCLPQGMTLDEVRGRIDESTEAMFQHQEFLAEAKFDSSQLDIPTEVERSTQMAYKALKYGPILLILVALMLSALLATVSPNHRSGFNLAIVLWILGGLLLIFISVIITSSHEQFIDSYVANSIESEHVIVLNEIAKPLFNVVALDLSQAYLYTGIGTVLLAFFLVVATYSGEFLINYQRSQREKKSSTLPL